MYALMDHQRDALFYMDCTNALGLFMDPGTGKTAIALTWTLRALKDGRIEDALVVCPASLVPNWADSISRMAMFEGVTDEDVELLREKVAISSYQKLYRTEKQVVQHRNGTESVKKRHVLRDNIDKLWGAVLVDESQALGSHSSTQTKVCLTLARLAKYRFIFTGTPVSGSSKGSGKAYSKLYGQIMFLEPGKWKSWKDFTQQYVISFDFWNNPERFDDAKCEELMSEYAIAAKLEDCVDLPESTYDVIPCPLAEKKVYNDLKEGDLEPYGIDVANAGGQYIKMMQVCSGSIKRTEDVLTLKCSKDAVLADILQGTDDKVVIFCNFRASIDRCEAICKENGRKTVVFDGRSTKPTWKSFQEGDADALVIQYQAGGAGLDLYASHTMVLFEPTLSSLLLTQSLARIHRKGQTRKCLYRYLETPDTLEAKVWKAVRNGTEVTDKLLAQLARGEI